MQLRQWLGRLVVPSALVLCMCGHVSVHLDDDGYPSTSILSCIRQPFLEHELQHDAIDSHRAIALDQRLGDLDVRIGTAQPAQEGDQLDLHVERAVHAML